MGYDWIYSCNDDEDVPEYYDEYLELCSLEEMADFYNNFEIVENSC